MARRVKGEKGGGGVARGESADARRNLAPVSAVLEEPAVHELLARWQRPVVVEAVRAALDGFRASLAAGGKAPAMSEIVARVRELVLDAEFQRLRPVVNATGIILHTGLGRAVLPQVAVDALAGLNGCCNLQIDLETGARGRRNYMTEQLLCRLTGAEAAMVVNNNAAATMLVLAALCAGREVVISRGQLIEIGGSYRLPDCIAQSGARMVEVGTTNKTHLRDYERALTPDTAALLRVHPSNYRIVGFTADVALADLVALRQKQDLLVIDDLGCGVLVNLEQFGLPHEPTVQESISAGADLALFSGDKLIGGPQAGIIVGRKVLIDRIKKHPLTRMLRVGKMTDMVLEQTLRLFLDPATLIGRNPTLRMLTAPADGLRRRARSMKHKLEKGAPALCVDVVQGESQVGGGSLPATPIPTWLLAVKADSGAGALCARLRRHEPPVIARIEDDRVMLDVRTLLDGEETEVVRALAEAVSGGRA